MSDPRRLRAGGGATEFERRLLDAASGERVPAALELRMQQALGISVGVASASAASAAAAATAGTTSKAAIVAWTSAGVLAVGFAGGLLAARIFARPPAPDVSAMSAPAPAAGVARLAHLARESTAPAHAPRAGDRRPRAAAEAGLASGRSGDLRGEIDLIDSARDALAARSAPRALELLRRYGARYPDGTFAPEATALRIEALEQGGQRQEAQGLARQFLTAHPDSPLADRISRIAR